MLQMLRNIWFYRQFIYSCVKREFQERYTGSVLGVLWAVFQPLTMIFVYTVIFSQVMKSKLAGMESIPYAYSIYLCTGLLTWNLFNETLMGCVNVFFKNANLMKKVSFPRICLPVITVLSALVNFAIGFGLFLVFLLLLGRMPWTAPLFFVVLFIQILFTVTLGVGFGVLNVFFRDVGQLLNVVLQLWFWFTPVVYPISIIPEYLRWLMYLNPMYYLTTSYQQIFVYNQLPSFSYLAFMLLLSALIGVAAMHLYQKHVGELVDEL